MTRQPQLARGGRVSSGPLAAKILVGKDFKSCGPIVNSIALWLELLANSI
ncbi:hypothetical protein [Microcoleus anatoxicus]